MTSLILLVSTIFFIFLANNGIYLLNSCQAVSHLMDFAVIIVGAQIIFPI